MIDIRTLTVQNIGPQPEQNTRVTLSPADIRLLIVHTEVPVALQGQEYKRVEVIFLDGLSYELFLSDYDINVMETTVGAFGLPLEE